MSKVTQVIAKLDKKKVPVLKEIDLSLAVEHECPGIKVGKTEYLARINGHWKAGNFDRQWYGLNFDAGLHSQQFDAPGWNCSGWEALYEIIYK